MLVLRFCHILSTVSSHLLVITSENLPLSFYSFTLKPKISQKFISAQLATWFCHDSQNISMPPAYASG